MSLRTITPEDAVTRLGEFSAVVDVRSEGEYAVDRLPGAVNWPVLHDAERHAVGTEYVQVSAFTARRRGAALVARNVADIVETRLAERGREWRPLIYCWRGGQRSGALATVLDRIGYGVHLLEGGYQAFRRLVVAQLAALPATLDWRVVCGRTGSAKSRLLQALARQGVQVLDLEALACHRGSLLGPLPGQPQPSQKAFETALWEALRGCDPARPVYAEGESRTIGRLRIPEPLLERLRAAPCVQVHMPQAARVEFLLRDYEHYTQDVEAFCQRLGALRELRGAATIARWQAQARGGELAGVVAELLDQHYDPVYLKSMPRNYAGYATAATLELPDGDPATLDAAAARIARADRASTPPAAVVTP